MKRIESSDDLRRLADLTSCPCYECVKDCNGMDKVSECVSYQKWYENKLRQRELRRKYGADK